MSTSRLDQQIATVIADAVAHVANLIKADIVAQLQLTTGRGRNGVQTGSAAKRAQGGAKAPGRGRRGRRSSLDEATVSRVFKVIEDTPGLRTEEIYKKLPVPPEQAKKALARLRADGRVKTKGQKRATTYAPA